MTSTRDVLTKMLSGEQVYFVIASIPFVALHQSSNQRHIAVVSQMFINIGVIVISVKNAL